MVTEPNGSEQNHKAGSNGTLRRIFVTALLILAGVSVLLYPVVATQINNVKQTEAAKNFDNKINAQDPAVLAESIRAAHYYNEHRFDGPILDPWLTRLTPDSPEYQEYLKELNLADAMARIVIPSIQADLPVYHGTEEKTLAKGVGHLFGSDLPVGGEGTHAVLTGHTALANATLFDNLDKVKKGDAFYISVSGEKLKYEVNDIRVVLPHEAQGLAPVAGEDLVTLITCTPYGINTHRLLVTGHRVPMDPDEAKVFDGTGFVMQWWMWALIIAGIIILLGLIWWIRRMMKRTREREEAEAAAAEEAQAYHDEDFGPSAY